MIDRWSIFADAKMGEMLRTKFVPVAIDQAYQRRQRDAEGEFYRRIAGQGPRKDFQNTTQGFYVANAAGELLLYNNNRDVAKVRRLVHEAWQRFAESEAQAQATAAIETGKVDGRYHPTPPDGGLVVRVRAKVLGGHGTAENESRRILESAISRDNLWLTRAEHEALVRGELPPKLLRRIARFHLVDNTRGEPPMWRPDEVRAIDVVLDDGRLQGSVHLETKDGKRGYKAQLLGFVRTAEKPDKQKLTALDIIAVGKFWGEGRYTRGAPAGEFPLAISLTLADGTDIADSIPPQGARGWIEGYLR